MNAEHWVRVSELFHAACEQPRELRGTFLAEACQADEELRREVESLLNQDASSDGVLEQVAQQAMAWGNAVPQQPSFPQTIGHYRIRKFVGEGGMGVVYEAEQENPRRTVAWALTRMS